VSVPHSTDTFNQHAGIYELLIDWPRRLSVEEPFYRQVFQSVGVKRVLDVACGTGHHAAMFHSWGLQVEGADLSPGMIAECRAQFGEPTGLRWVVRGFQEPVGSGEPFDAVLCVGNSLALADDVATVERAVANMLEALRPGGVVILGLLNLWSLVPGRTVWQKCKRVSYAGGDHVVLKSIHRCGNRAHISFVDLELGASTVSPRYDTAELLGLRAEDLLECIHRHGGTEAHVYGSYRFEPYVPSQSGDLIITCRRNATI